MAKRVPKQIAAADDGRTDFAVCEGVPQVNGKKVSGKIVRLTVAEALYDLALGRIERVTTAPAGRNDGAGGDGRD